MRDGEENAAHWLVGSIFWNRAFGRRELHLVQEQTAMPLAQLNGIECFYQETGNGDALLLINGLNGTCLDWEPLVPALSQHFRVISSDNRGVGRSAAPPGPYTTRQMADDAAALLAHLGVRHSHIVGYSMGGMIAQELALAYPSLVNRLC
jgi:pimeloyl-ACP methyl ester carboxylesterase